MSDVRDPFDDLRRPVVPLGTRPEFAASLRRRLQEEIEMTGTTTSRQVHGDLAMVHLRVGDADRAIAFFGALFDWEAERVLFDEHVSHYTINTAMTIRLLDDPDAPPMVPNYAVDGCSRRHRGRRRGRRARHRSRTRARRRRMGARCRRPRSAVAGVPPGSPPRTRGADAPGDG